MKITMNNPAYGDCGPWDVEDGQTFEQARDKLVDEMMPQIREWANEQIGYRQFEAYSVISDAEWIETRVDEMRDELRRAIRVYGEEVPR